MAKVNFGPLANDARGKIAGIVYSKNKSGAYTRTKVTPANPSTPAQTLVRQNLGNLAQQWSGTLASSDRAAWTSYAATYPRLDVFGNSIVLNGLNMFISLNTVLLNTGNPIATDPPANNIVTPIPTDPAYIQVVESTGILHFSQTGAQVDGDDVYYLFAAAPMAAGRNPVKSDYRFIGTLTPGTTAFPVYQQAGVLYKAKFGNWQVGQKLCLLIATMRTGSGLTTTGLQLQGIST